MRARTLPVRTLFLDRGLNFHGGVTRALLNLARSARPEQLHIEIGSLEPPSPEMLGEFGSLGVPVHHLGDQGYLRPALALRRVLRTSGIQLLVCNSFRSYLISKLAVAGQAVRVLFWVHGIGELTASAAKSWLYRQLSWQDTLIFVSEAVRRANLPRGHTGRHHVVHHGVENPGEVPKWQPYAPSAREGLGLAPEDVVLLYVGSFAPYKDQPTLLRAFDRLWSRHPRLRLLLVGRGERLGPTQELAASLPSRAHIHFLGVRSDARQLLGVADLYVHPAHPEAFGLAIVEAMLAHLPVVGAADGGIPEIVQDGVSGLLFRPGDADELERKLETLLEQPALARRLADAGYLRATTRFSPQRFVDQMTRVLLAEAGVPETATSVLGTS